MAYFIVEITMTLGELKEDGSRNERIDNQERRFLPYCTKLHRRRHYTFVLRRGRDSAELSFCNSA